MLAPFSWLCDYAAFDQFPLEQLSETLSSLGLVVEGLTEVGGDLPGVVVARIQSIRPHPSADRIRLVDVDAGEAETLQIACGAQNFAVGDLVPLARVGAKLPGGVDIGRRKMRGEWSEGMLCSATEVGLPEGEDGLLILPTDLVAGTPMAEVLGGRDYVFDLDISPNRPDAMSMAGVSRDLAGALGLEWNWPSPPQSPEVAEDPSLGRPVIEVAAPELCPRFCSVVLSGVQIGASPLWMARRLALAGMRPINSVVDASNYLMLDMGQPNHAYDRDTLGGGGLGVRMGGDGEKIVTLDGVERALFTDDLVITDAQDVPVGVAGVMGSDNSGITQRTTTLLLECAWFRPVSIARTGGRLGLFSEARQRFERGVDSDLAPVALRRLIQLLAAVSPSGLSRGPEVDLVSDADLPRPAQLQLRTSRVNLLLGTDLEDAQIAGHLRSIGFSVEESGPGLAQVNVPSWRPDTEREADLIEEVARLHGYPNIPRRVPRTPQTGRLDALQKMRRELREIFVGAGIDEAWTSTFLAPEDLSMAGLSAPPVRVANPLDQSDSVLRTSLLPGMLKAVRLNLDRQNPQVRFFEIGRVFDQPVEGSSLPTETERLAVLLPGADAQLAAGLWQLLFSALRLEGVTPQAEVREGMHPTRTLALGVGEDLLGHVGEMDPDAVSAYGLSGRVAVIDLDVVQLLRAPRVSRLASPISRFPAADFDLAFVVDEQVTADLLRQSISASVGPHVEQIRLIDVYRGDTLGEGRKSQTWRVRLRASERTLSEVDIAGVREQIIARVGQDLGGQLRG